MQHSKSGDSIDLLAAVENAPEIMDASDSTVKQCVVQVCDDGTNVQGEVLVASCEDGQPESPVVQCDR